MKREKELLQTEDCSQAEGNEQERQPYSRPCIVEERSFSTFSLNCKLIANCSNHAPVRSS
jgi:hypothetical protein